MQRNPSYALSRNFVHRVVRQGRDAVGCVYAARRKHHAGYARLIRRFLSLYVTRAYSIAEIRRLDLLDPSLGRAHFVARQSKQAQLELQIALNPREYWALTEDKRIFDYVCRGAGLTVPKIYGTFIVPGRSAGSDRSASRASAAAIFRATEGKDFVVKPTRGVYGRSVWLLHRDGDLFVVENGVAGTAEDVFDWIDEQRDDRFDDFIVQERVYPHEDLVRLSGSRHLSTARMVSYVTKARSVVIGCCQLRIIVGDAVADNFAGGTSGNLIADIQVATGRLQSVFGAAANGLGLAPHHVHPVTGVRFDEFVVPYWLEARRLVNEAALALLPLQTIGWDVAITPSGPMLIEGNVSWDTAYEGQVGGEIIRAIRADRVQSESLRPKPETQ